MKKVYYTFENTHEIRLIDADTIEEAISNVLDTEYAYVVTEYTRMYFDAEIRELIKVHSETSILDFLDRYNINVDTNIFSEFHKCSNDKYIFLSTTEDEQDD